MKIEKIEINKVVKGVIIAGALCAAGYVIYNVGFRKGFDFVRKTIVYNNEVVFTSNTKLMEALERAVGNTPDHTKLLKEISEELLRSGVAKG